MVMRSLDSPQPARVAGERGIGGVNGGRGGRRGRDQRSAP
jgi:hypothetical protein